MKKSLHSDTQDAKSVNSRLVIVPSSVTVHRCN